MHDYVSISGKRVNRLHHTYLPTGGCRGGVTGDDVKLLNLSVMWSRMKPTNFKIQPVAFGTVQHITMHIWLIHIRVHVRTRYCNSTELILYIGDQPQQNGSN